MQARLRGLAALLALLLIVAIPAVLISSILSTFKFGWIIEALLATALIAQHSLHEHVSAVGKGLDTSLMRRAQGGEPRSSAAIPPHSMNQASSKARSKASPKTPATASWHPCLWYALLGLPGIVVYKAINTADSMIGHKSERYIYFGWAAARLDDLVNLPASRLTGLLFVSCRRMD